MVQITLDFLFKTVAGFQNFAYTNKKNVEESSNELEITFSIVAWIIF